MSDDTVETATVLRDSPLPITEITFTRTGANEFSIELFSHRESVKKVSCYLEKEDSLTLSFNEPAVSS